MKRLVVKEHPSIVSASVTPVIELHFLSFASCILSHVFFLPTASLILRCAAVLLEPLKESDARATAQIAVGDVEDEGSGFFLSLRFLHKANGKDAGGHLARRFPIGCEIKGSPG